jgi:glycine/D-amino acid oxidase-like deaminating enzyme
MDTIATDILVIGAGLTGAMIAARLAEQGQQVAVMDAQYVGSAATRRALGVATPMPHATHFDTTWRGAQSLGRIAARHGIAMQPTRVLHLATSPQGEAALRALADQHPGKLTWTTETEHLPAGFTAGLLARDGALVDVELLTVRLLQQPGVIVKQHVEAIKLEARDGMTYAVCSDTLAAARHVVLATNIYTGLLSPYLADSVRGVRGAVWTSFPVRTDGDAPKFDMPIFVDDASLMLTPGIGPDARLKAAAWSWNGYAANANGGGDPSEQLTRFLKRVHPALTEQTEQWQAAVTTATDDGAPLTGRLDGDGSVLYAIGLGPFGLAWSPIVADRIAELAR